MKKKQKSKQKVIRVQNTWSNAGHHFIAKFAAFLLVHFRQQSKCLVAKKIGKITQISETQLSLINGILHC
jgi:hypothetical protein